MKRCIVLMTLLVPVLTTPANASDKTNDICLTVNEYEALNVAVEDCEGKLENKEHDCTSGVDKATEAHDALHEISMSRHEELRAQVQEMDRRFSFEIGVLYLLMSIAALGSMLIMFLGIRTRK